MANKTGHIPEFLLPLFPILSRQCPPPMLSTVSFQTVHYNHIAMVTKKKVALIGVGIAQSVSVMLITKSLSEKVPISK